MYADESKQNGTMVHGRINVSQEFWVLWGIESGRWPSWGLVAAIKASRIQSGAHGRFGLSIV